MRNIKIVADSSADLLELKNIPFAVAPLKIITDTKEFIDDEAWAAVEMADFFDTYKGKSKTSCPNPSDWLDAFGDGEEVFCVTITSGLSGSYNAACIAKQMFEAEHPGRRVCVIDSLSAGPELVLIIEKLEQYISQGLFFGEIEENIRNYQKSTGLLFMLESLKNFAANGRVSPAVAKITGLLGIRVVGKASDQGTLEPLDKCRGQARALSAILDHLEESGLRRGKVQIAHNNNEAAALELKQAISRQFPDVQVNIHTCRGLCSYYAEKGGMLVGYEKF